MHPLVRFSVCVCRGGALSLIHTNTHTDSLSFSLSLSLSVSLSLTLNLFGAETLQGESFLAPKWRGGCTKGGDMSICE